MRSLLSAMTFSVLLFFQPATAHAESQNPVPVSFNSQADAFTALQELDNSLLGALVWSTTINGGKCKPKFSVGFFKISLVYEASETCPLLGKVALGFFPLSADVDLDVNMQNVDRIQLKAKISVKYTKDSGVALQLYFTDGRITLKQGANSAWTDMIVNGSTAMNFSKSNYGIAGRKNIFHAATAAGFTLLTQVTKSPEVRRFEGCLLTGGVSSDVNAGTLTMCTPLFK